jgi:hypothetical protein
MLIHLGNLGLAHVLLNPTCPMSGHLSAQTNRKRCELAEGSVKFESVIEEQESRRTRKEIWLDKNNKRLSTFGRHEHQPGRILETVTPITTKV